MIEQRNFRRAVAVAAAALVADVAWIDGSSTRHHGGMGLGLFLARQLAVSMGGRLDVDDTSRGARLHVTLPAAGMLDAQRPSLLTERSKPPTAPPDSRAARSRRL